MKKVKFLSFIMAVVLCVMSFASTILAVDPRNTNTRQTFTAFVIDDSGVATVHVEYIGQEGMVTDATITISIKKKVALFFWSEVSSHTYTSTETNFSGTFQHTLDDTGTYKCNVEYSISGITGVTDKIPFEDTETYTK